MKIDVTIEDLQSLIRDLTSENAQLRLAVTTLRRIVVGLEAEAAKNQKVADGHLESTTATE